MNKFKQSLGFQFYLASEKSLAKLWNTKKENVAWQFL